MPTSVALTPHFEALTQQFVASGRYNNVSEVIWDGLRLLEARALEESAKLAALKGAVRKGIDDIENGHVTTLNTPQDIESFVRQAGQRASARIQQAD